MAFLTDGYQTLISFSIAITVNFKEKDVMPPGLDGNGEIDTTTMRNSRWRTKQPKHLVTADDMKVTVQYDPIIYQTVVNTLLNQNGTIIVSFPDGSTLEFWGWVDKFIPAALKEGEFPLADITIHPSNQDDSGNEQAPIYTA